MNKNKGDLETSRMSLLGQCIIYFRKYFKYIAVVLIVLLLVGVLGLTIEVFALQKDNQTYSTELVELALDNQDLEKENEVLQNNVIQLESEVQTGNETLVKYESKLEQYKTEEEIKKKAEEEKKQQQIVISAPSGSWGSKKTYMSYKAITNTRSKQYQLQQQAVTDPNTGIRMIDGDYCVAIGSGWGCAVGDRILVTLEGGKTLNAIVADAKANAHTNSDNKTTTHDGSVIEFVVDIPSLPKAVRTSGSLGTLEMFSGGVISITKR